MLRTPVKMVAAALAAGAVLTACGGQVKLGAAAVMSTDRISASTLSAQVANLNKNYQKYKDQIQLHHVYVDRMMRCTLHNQNRIFRLMTMSHRKS